MGGKIAVIDTERLSVSTSGSKGVQRVITGNTPKSVSAFSIHKRIEGGATANFGRFYRRFYLI